MKLLQQFKDLGLKVTGSYADGTQWECSYVPKGMSRAKGVSDIDFSVPVGKLDEVKKILTNHKIVFEEFSKGIITRDTYPAFDFSEHFWEREKRKKEVDIFGVVFETH